MPEGPERSYTRVRGRWLGGKRTEISVRDLSPVYVDEPREAGGTNTAPRPTEYLVSGLVGSIATLGPSLAAARGVSYRGMAVEAEAWLDLRGVRGETGADPAFKELALRIRVETHATCETVAALGAEVERLSPILVMLRRAGVDVRVTWQVEPNNSA